MRVTNQRANRQKAEVVSELLTVQQAADRLALSVWTLRSWAYSGRIATVKIGGRGRLLVPRTELDRLIRENLRPSTT